MFFGEHKSKAALVDGIILVGSIGGYIAAASHVDKPAALIMVPYFGWCNFATVLNEEIARLNS